jgi:hypothetical protein
MSVEVEIPCGTGAKCPAVYPNLRPDEQQLLCSKKHSMPILQEGCRDLGCTYLESSCARARKLQGKVPL